VGEGPASRDRSQYFVFIKTKNALIPFPHEDHNEAMNIHHSRGACPPRRRVVDTQFVPRIPWIPACTGMTEIIGFGSISPMFCLEME
jgi:hypothetical protein